MPSKLPVVTFVLSEDLMKRLDDFRFENRIGSRSEAIRMLLEKALKDPDKNPTKK